MSVLCVSKSSGVGVFTQKEKKRRKENDTKNKKTKLDMPHKYYYTKRESIILSCPSSSSSPALSPLAPEVRDCKIPPFSQCNPHTVSC